jgi:predicted MFS family arabinose efflux permease
LFRNGVFNTTNVAGFLAGMAMFGGTVYLPLYLQLVTGVSPTLSGLLLLPLMLGLTLTSVATGRLIARTGRYKLWPVFGAILMPTGMFLLSLMTGHTPRWESALFMIPLGAGLGMIMPVLIVAIQNATAHEDLGTATSSNVFFRSMGSAFGVAVFGAIMNARLGYWFPKLVPRSAGVDAQSVAFSPAAVRHLPRAVQTGIIDAFSHSLHTVFLVATPVALLTLPFIFLMKELPLRTDAYLGAATLSSVGAEAPVEAFADDTPG